MGALLEIALLGPPRVVLNGQPAIEGLSGKTLALLIYIAVVGQPQTRESVAGLFWGDAPDTQARNSLRVALASLRKVIPEHVLITNQTIAFNRASTYWLDIEDLQARTAALDKATADGLRPLVPLYRGEFLHDFSIDGGAEWQEWVLAQRALWQQRASDGLIRLADLLMAAHDYTSARIVLQRNLHINPWQEPAHRQLMLAYGRMGDFTAALAQYERCRHALVAELGVEPMPETMALAEQIEAAQQTHRRPLPQESMPFVGRAAELDRIAQLLLTPSCRLLTIVGLGGMGKSRLALEAARLANRPGAIEFMDGVVWVSLTGVQSPDILPQTIAEVLDVKLTGQTDTLTGLLRYLRHKELLLVLDNIEHLLPSGAALVQQILDHSPAVKLLATSREPLQLAAEWRLNLAGLEYTGDESVPLEAQSATQLFIQTARQVRPDFRVTENNIAHVRRLCQLVAGAPLALKLAVPWLHAMEVEQIVVELEHGLDLLTTHQHDLPPRQRSMRVIFDATWALLDPDEQHVLAALSVFQGGFSAQAAAVIAGSTPALLSTLNDRSLVVARPYDGGLRYELHELTRQYAALRLVSSALQVAIAQQHSTYYLAWLAEQDAALHTAERPAAMAAVRQDLANVRQAWQSALEHVDHTSLQPAVEALSAFYENAGLFQEGEQVFHQAYLQLDTDRSSGHDSLLAVAALQRQLLAKATWFALLIGQHDLGAQRIALLFDMAKRAGDERRLADAHFFSGHLSYVQGAREEAIAAFELAATQYRALQAWHAIIYPLSYIGLLMSDAHLLDRSIAVCEEALAIARKSRNAHGLALLTAQIAATYGAARLPERAEPYFRQAIAQFEALDDVQGLSRTLCNLGYNHTLLAQYQQAQTHLERALRYVRQTGERLFEVDIHDNLAIALFELGRYEQAQRQWESALAVCHEIGYKRAEAYVTVGLGRLALAQGQLTQAQVRLRHAIALAEEVDQPRDRAQASGYLAQVQHLSGDTDPALAAIEICITDLRRIEAHYECGYFLLEHAALLWELGRPEAAQPVVREGLETLRLVGHPLLLWKGQLLAANIALALGDPSAAQAQYAQALRHVPDLTNGPELMQAIFYAAHYLLGLQRPAPALRLLAGLANEPTAAYSTRRGVNALLETYAAREPRSVAAARAQVYANSFSDYLALMGS
jgi:predicted ATPase/DNA-binding SARP family transcriptional activator